MKRKIIAELLFEDDDLNYTSMKLLALASASMIIQECENWELNFKDNFYPSGETVLGKLNSNFIWPRHNLIIALESHVEIVYGFVKYSLENFNGKRYSEFYWIDEEGATFLTNALEVYQEWKNSVIKRGAVKDGETWGRPVGSDKAIWNVYNKELLELCKKRGY